MSWNTYLSLWNSGVWLNSLLLERGCASALSYLPQILMTVWLHWLGALESLKNLGIAHLARFHFHFILKLLGPILDWLKLAPDLTHRLILILQLKHCHFLMIGRHPNFLLPLVLLLPYFLSRVPLPSFLLHHLTASMKCLEVSLDPSSHLYYILSSLHKRRSWSLYYCHIRLCP